MATEEDKDQKLEEEINERINAPLLDGPEAAELFKKFEPEPEEEK